MNAPLALSAAPEPLRAIMRSFEFTCVATTAPAARKSALSTARRAAPLANPKSKIENRKS